MTMEEVLRLIKQERGMSALSGEQLIALFQDFSKNQLRPQANALKVFVNCQGNTRILKLQNAAVHEQQVQFYRLVRELVTEQNMQEETALEVCSTFWRVALETEPPKYNLPPVPPPKPIDEEIDKNDKPVPPDPIPPAPNPKPREFKLKYIAIPVLLLALVLTAVTFMNDSTGERTRSDLEPFQLEESIEDMLLAGTEQIYTYPDDSRMEFYYDDSGKEIYRLYADANGDIQNLFEARYDSDGRLVYHQIFDGQGNLLRSDSYDFHSSEDTAQRRVTLGDGRSFQGVSTFDENGYETFTVTHEDGTQTVSTFKDGGILAHRTLLDADGNSPDVIYGDDPVYVWIDWEDVPKVYGPQQTVMGWTNAYGFVRSYVQGLCGGMLKEYSVSVPEDAAFIDTYDPMGNLLERLYYRDAQMSVLGSHEIYRYDSSGIYTGYTETYYVDDGHYWISTYDENGIELTMENHHFNAEGVEEVSYERYETELDDQGREIRVQTFDAETGKLISVDETVYDTEGNVHQETRTYYHEDGGYSVDVRDGEGKNLSDVTYYPSGKIEYVTDYNADGQQTKLTWYYESGQVEWVQEYNDQGEPSKRTDYYENGQIESLMEYNELGEIVKITHYYESGQIRSLDEYNDQGEITNSVYYKEDGTILD